ncbi:MAG: NAD(P)H-hydrate dehydratase [Verrucomicrobiota bacterium]|nr:NAD(P)H-hydrate dehydratase [Verrucomicrobiota bacterium]
MPGLQGEGSKETRGRALIVAGSEEMPGAAILASTAALRAGAGKVRVATAEAVAVHVASAVPELFVSGLSDRGAVLASAKKTDVVLIGPGMRDNDVIRKLLGPLLKIETLRALIIDASALPLIGRVKLHERTMVTPHAGEMSALLKLEKEALDDDSLGYARRFAQDSGAVVVLKGTETLICDSRGDSYLNKRGHVGLATAGSGDVLAGIVAGFCARGAPPLQAAVWAVSLHARAGGIGFLAREILDQIPRLTSDLS